MKYKIKQSLTDPYSKTYQAVYFLHKYVLLYLPILFLLIVSYPLMQAIYLKSLLTSQQEQQKELTNELTKQTNLLDSLQQHLEKTQNSNPSLTKINQKIQLIFEKYQTTPEQWQWNLSDSSQLYLTFNQSSNALFKIIYELNQIPTLYAKEITLRKLHQEKLVQFNATFILLQ